LIGSGAFVSLFPKLPSPLLDLITIALSNFVTVRRNEDFLTFLRSCSLGPRPRIVTRLHSKLLVGGLTKFSTLFPHGSARAVGFREYRRWPLSPLPFFFHFLLCFPRKWRQRHDRELSPNCFAHPRSAQRFFLCWSGLFFPP